MGWRYPGRYSQRQSRQLKGTARRRRLLVAVEEAGADYHRARTHGGDPRLQKRDSVGFSKDNVEPGSTVYTDGLKKLYWVERSWLSPRAPKPTAANGPAEGRRQSVPLAGYGAVGNLSSSGCWGPITV